ncbi:flagellar basal-body MS-ring/collar protein FliF [Maritimibacter alkaliphilus]|uniref:flagellar basal-body MS-ring/collar protein FliF n=1 Tax=Maritimibacter alkaliphilus TaxID=404236 RepID=UPI001C97969C|nr:flagellar basal-body MS-ring/collar protein FliF [Maritimibacter alkaliphilus]MBY6090625.1 flagellar M-ring protein FliF [Maritimibacter alkaliphilus]
MQQISTLWGALDTRRRVIAGLAALAMFASVLALGRMAVQPSMVLLYSGLENGQAGEVVRALEQRGLIYEVRGGAIFVEAGSRDELRMTLASEGLPRNSARGYELLDSLNGFGTTSQMFDAAYWRAKEGELARTIAASPQVDAARVHIAHAGTNPFQRDFRPTASVWVTTAGGTVTGAQAKALKFLVSSAVAGLSPDDVAVIDAAGELIAASDEEPRASASDDKAEQLRDRVQRLLEARVGYGNVVVEVSVDTETESESIRERLFDPASRVAISTDTEESSNSAQNANAGQVTVASNLPNGNAGADTQGSSSQSSETRERVNYEVSATEREVTRAPGAVKRLTVAVLVNGTLEQGEDGAPAFTPRSDAELEAMRELVASAVGFNETRGDVITLKTMQFEATPAQGTDSSGALLDQLLLDPMALIRIAVLAAVALILGLFVLRPLLRRPSEEGMMLPAPAGTMDQETALTGEIEEDDFALPDLPMLSGFDGGTQDLPEDASPVDRLRALIAERRGETVEILRSWLEDREGTT